ncbi:hypothetical protein [Hydrogenimonas urashimensis]|uniref:hypothetical protein n=1 Tax=Hydrogenimonas urashimensis TaxID=2740515 RepID=UPI00191696A6|nr:hypothetical protein [Hydrogenimonas urashimensis]
MRILLINQNPIVSKLAGLSAQKSGYEIVEEFSLDEMERGDYDVLFIDSAKLDAETPETLKRRTGVKRTCLIYAEDEEKIPGFDYYIKKPFLPTEMVDLMGEINDDLLFPEMEAQEEKSMEETAPSEPSVEAGSEPVGEELEKEAASEEEKIVGAEDFDMLLEELEAETHEAEKEEEAEAAEEDFEALMASLEAQEGAQEATPAPSAAEEEPIFEAEEETKEEAEAMPEKAEATEEAGEAFDFDKLLEEVEVTEETETAEGAEEDFEALLEGLDLEIAEKETVEEERAETPQEEIGEEEEPISLPEPEEPAGGVLDEELVTEVKELLGEEPQSGTEEEEELTEPEWLEAALSEEREGEPEEAQETVGEKAAEEEMPEEISLEEIEGLEMLEDETPQLPQSDEFAQISEEELGAVLGEEIAEESGVLSEPAAEKQIEKEELQAAEKEERPAATGAEGVLISRLLGTDPEALRKLLAGAEITINISFPKDV